MVVLTKCLRGNWERYKYVFAGEELCQQCDPKDHAAGEIFFFAT